MTIAPVSQTGRLLPVIATLAADGLHPAAIARQLHLEPLNVRRWMAKPAFKALLESELGARREATSRIREAAAGRVLKRAIEAAEGRWEPSQSQLELIRYFVGWDAPVASDGMPGMGITGATSAIGQIVVNLPPDWSPPMPVIEATVLPMLPESREATP